MARKRLGRGMGHGCNNTVSRVRCPRGIRAIRFGKVREDGINITRLGVDKVILQGYLEGGFFDLGKMGCDIFANGR